MMQRAPDRIVAWARTGMLSHAVRTCLRPVRAGRGLARSSQLLMPSRCMSNYPAHTVVGLPALSPTMTHGNLAKWLKKEGETIGPGDVICEIETDKATVDFEAQDEGIVAKLLVKESTSDIPVGAPIFVMVEEASSVAAFADFTVSHSPAAAPKAEAPVAAPAPAPAKPTTPPPPPKAVAAPAPPPPAPKPVPKPEVAPATAAAAPAAPIPDSLYAFKRWGSLGRDGPLAKRLVKMQKEYVKAYGPTLTEVSP